MKKYVCPKNTVVIIETTELLAESSISLSTENTITGGQRSKKNEDWFFDDEEDE